MNGNISCWISTCIIPWVWKLLSEFLYHRNMWVMWVGVGGIGRRICCEVMGFWIVLNIQPFLYFYIFRHIRCFNRIQALFPPPWLSFILLRLAPLLSPSSGHIWCICLVFTRFLEANHGGVKMYGESMARLKHQHSSAIIQSHVLERRAECRRMDFCDIFTMFAPLWFQ